MAEMHPAYIGQAVRAIAVLALPAESQIDYLRSFGLGEPASAEDLGSEFGELSLRLGTLIENQWLSARTTLLMQEIDSLLAKHEGDEGDDFWLIESLSSHSDWIRIRRAALRLLPLI